MPTPFDWTPIFGIEFRFASASNPTAATSLNKTYSEIIGKDELSEFFVTREGKEAEGPLEIAPDPQLHILNCVAKTIAINLIDPDEVTKRHISNLLHKCVIKHVRHNGSRKRMRSRTEFDAAAKHAIRTNTDEEPIVLFELTITHWRFKNKWRPDLFMQAYTRDPPSAPASRHAIRTNTDEEPIVLFELTITHWRFKNKWRPDLFMQAYTRDPPSAPASRAQFANLLQRQYTTPKAASPDAPILAPITPAEAKKVNATIPSDTTKMVGSNAVATPVTALSGTPANFRRTFTLQSQSVVFHRLPKPVSGITKRHRDALKIKMYHLYANILSMNWFYDTFD
eukprot:jgi/Psemu1/57148/gm1.57148_g